MPRISPKLARLARESSLLLPPLLRANKTIDSAKQELRWIQQELPKNKWKSAIRERSQLIPLQYILGSQPFGSLDIHCRPGVLIPRWETEEWVTELADAFGKRKNTTNNGKLLNSLNVIDACTGTGCIPLLLHSDLLSKGVCSNVTGFDISLEAYKLSCENLAIYESSRDISDNGKVSFKHVDIFSHDLLEQLEVTSRSVDLITSNPPYIPLQDYKLSVDFNGTSRSVRLHEPALALVGENEFYETLITKLVLPTKAKAFVFELGYEEQAQRVKELLFPFKKWKVKRYTDSAGNIRCVLGWIRGSNMSVLDNITRTTEM